MLALVQQSLVALKVNLSVAASLAQRDPAKAQELLLELGTGIERTIESLRELARGLYPALLADHGLVAAPGCASPEDWNRGRDRATDVSRYPQEVEAAVYFSCLEALQNSGKHAKASHVRLGLREQDGRLELKIEDDGVGFDPASSRSGSGLQNISDRIEAVGGSLEIQSAPGEGTSLIGWVPLQH